MNPWPRALGRVAWITLLGTLAFTLCGMVQGALAGMVFGYTFFRGNLFLGNIWMLGASFGAAYSGITSLVCGGIVFLTVGIRSMRHAQPWFLWRRCLRNAVVGSFLGIFAGTAILLVNFFVLTYALERGYLESVKNHFLFVDIVNFTLTGIIGGFALGALIGGIRTALRLTRTDAVAHRIHLRGKILDTTKARRH